jgi:hypothetical protein
VDGREPERQSITPSFVELMRKNSLKNHDDDTHTVDPTPTTTTTTTITTTTTTTTTATTTATTTLKTQQPIELKRPSPLDIPEYRILSYLDPYTLGCNAMLVC